MSLADLAEVVAQHGGMCMEVIDRRLGGYRLRLWLPSVRAANETAQVARGAGYTANVMESLDGLALRHDGWQVVVMIGEHVKIRPMIGPGGRLALEEGDTT